MKRLLLADIGGTYARFTFTSGLTIGPTWATEVGARRNVVEAVAAFIKADGGSQRIDGALFATAGPVQGGRCHLTNAPWIIDEEELAHAFNIPWVRVVNDLEAVAAGLPDLPLSQTRLIGPATSVPGAPMAIIAPGTGLGMACLFAGPGGRCVLPSEGGHAALAPMDKESEAIISFLRRRYGRVSSERVLSGSGLSNLHDAIVALEGGMSRARTPVEVTTGAFNGSCPACRTAVDTFCAFLGAVAGDMALMFGALGGIFIGGGIVPRFVDHLARSSFRSQFEAKGRLKPYVARIPTRVILHPTPAFIGLLSLAEGAGAVRRQPSP
ncbi:glucokinase [Enhydrobacter aerosaccus]|uniref:Glucokinase n=1 Tax=Enhydrobacter aerosaccus TaxID=225324 RepID=A0A1T4R8Y4_9HYPH|nr:glucokinase [Enhydrobacter aerosaccus]SKA12423.1 glucokinase [Enhydrobacter aerosaccus]